MRIYTKTGDKGQTGVVGGERVSKDSPVIRAVGDLDELNCVLALALGSGLDFQTESLILRVQSRLFDAGAEASSGGGIPGDYQGLVAQLEEAIDGLQDKLPALRVFILPGGSEQAVKLHHARAVCRRAERSLITLYEADQVTPQLMGFVNRLSDWLFCAARWENSSKGVTDTPWIKEQQQ